MSTKEGLSWVAGLATVGFVATSASNTKLEKEVAKARDEAARAEFALATANAHIADLQSQLGDKQAECDAAYADRNRFRESFEATTRQARSLQVSLDREARERTATEAQRDQERILREASESRACAETTRANQAVAQSRELEHQNARLARELADLRQARDSGD